MGVSGHGNRMAFSRQERLCSVPTIRSPRSARDSVVADIGSGTGLPAGLFIEFACRVFAVEPDTEMRRAAEAEYGLDARFASVAGTAGSTT